MIEFERRGPFFKVIVFPEQEQGQERDSTRAEHPSHLGQIAPGVEDAEVGENRGGKDEVEGMSSYGNVYSLARILPNGLYFWLCIEATRKANLESLFEMFR